MSNVEIRCGDAIATVCDLEKETNSLKNKLVAELESERFERNRSKNKAIILESLRRVRGGDMKAAGL